MTTSFRSLLASSTAPLRAALVASCLVWAAAPASAERADRFKKMEVESDQPGKVDLQKHIVTFNGNVVVTKGTMSIRANRIEVRESPDGYQYAIATGSPGSPARFRQKREGMDEYIEGQAERLEYESKADLLRLIDKAQVRRLRGTEVADEVIGALIVYDNAAEVFTVSGGTSAATPTNPTGRVRVVLVPRAGSPAAAEAASAAAAASGAGR